MDGFLSKLGKELEKKANKKIKQATGLDLGLGKPTDKPGKPGKPAAAGYGTSYPGVAPASSGGYPAVAPAGSGGYPAMAPATSGGYPAVAPTGSGGYPTVAPATSGGYPAVAPATSGGYPAVQGGHPAGAAPSAPPAYVAPPTPPRVPTAHTAVPYGAAASHGRPPAEPSLNEEWPRHQIRTVEEFLEARDSIATTPYGGAVLFLHALLNYAQPASHAVGQQMLVLSMWEEQLVPGCTYKSYALAPADEQRLAAALAPPNDHVARSFVAGAVAEQGYWYDPSTVGVRFHQQEIPPAATEAQVLLWTSGAEAPRPIMLRKNKKGFWKVVSFEWLLAPVQPPLVPLHTAADDL